MGIQIVPPDDGAAHIEGREHRVRGHLLGILRRVILKMRIGRTNHCSVTSDEARSSLNALESGDVAVLRRGFRQTLTRFLEGIIAGINFVGSELPRLSDFTGSTSSVEKDEILLSVITECLSELSLLACKSESSDPTLDDPHGYILCYFLAKKISREALLAQMQRVASSKRQERAVPPNKTKLRRFIERYLCSSICQLDSPLKEAAKVVRWGNTALGNSEYQGLLYGLNNYRKKRVLKCLDVRRKDPGFDEHGHEGAYWQVVASECLSSNSLFRMAQCFTDLKPGESLTPRGRKAESIMYRSLDEEAVKLGMDPLFSDKYSD